MKIFAAASIGGHWKQLLRITKPLEKKFEVVYASTHPKCASMTDGGTFYLMNDFSRKDAWRMIPAFFRLLRVDNQLFTRGETPSKICLVFIEGFISLFI